MCPTRPDPASRLILRGRSHVYANYRNALFHLGFWLYAEFDALRELRYQCSFHCEEGHAFYHPLFHYSGHTDKRRKEPDPVSYLRHTVPGSLKPGGLRSGEAGREYDFARRGIS
jgi:hypothetical protein